MNEVQIKPQRHSIRLKYYDYSLAGAYFVTIVVNHRNSLFGEIIDENFLANPAGKKISQIWTHLPNRFPSIRIDEFCVMPNHFHGIVVINPPLNDHPTIPVGAALVAALGTINSTPERVGTSPAPTRQPTLGEIIGAFKSMTTNAYIQGVRDNGWQPFYKTLWQRNYYEHIIRNEDELNRTREYLMNNALQWALDTENPNKHS